MSIHDIQYGDFKLPQRITNTVAFSALSRPGQDMLRFLAWHIVTQRKETRFVSLPVDHLWKSGVVDMRHFDHTIPVLKELMNSGYINSFFAETEEQSPAYGLVTIKHRGVLFYMEDEQAVKNLQTTSSFDVFEIPGPIARLEAFKALPIDCAKLLRFIEWKATHIEYGINYVKFFAKELVIVDMDMVYKQKKACDMLELLRTTGLIRAYTTGAGYTDGDYFITVTPMAQAFRTDIQDMDQTKVPAEVTPDNRKPFNAKPYCAGPLLEDLHSRQIAHDLSPDASRVLIHIVRETVQAFQTTAFTVFVHTTLPDIARECGLVRENIPRTGHVDDCLKELAKKWFIKYGPFTDLAGGLNRDKHGTEMITVSLLSPTIQD